MKIGKFDLAKDVLVIAEVGNNHEGNFSLAQDLIGLAAKAGAGAVKFQTIVPEKLVSPLQTERIQQLKRFQFSYEQFSELKRTADREGILFLSTPFDLESAKFLDTLVPAFKIASGDNNFFPLLKTVADTCKPIILSSGLTDLYEIRASKDFIFGVWQRGGFSERPLVILHCIASYPVPPAEANLLAMQELKSLGVEVGFSDHTIGIDAACLSVALGGRIIEKHFTIDKNYSDFRDHKLSVDPQELKELVERVKDTLLRLGDGKKAVQASEKESLAKARRSITAGTDLAAGTVLQLSHLSWVRPGGGIAPGREEEVVGRRLQRALQAGEMILQKDLE